ncbi:protein FAM200A-like [Hydra vulgaris]|uniref:Protein FAM200A-like n=1 Tax=Hydra vulgaris TaxID=6087 RepID=A0ABM4DBU2_HYDVU
MSKDVEIHLIEKLKTSLFLVQVDESTLRDNETVLLTYVRYIDKNYFAEEIIFCKSLKSSTTAKDICSTLKNYLDTNKIQMKNLTSCAADGAPNMMGKKNGCSKLMKDENPDMLLVHCVFHRENLMTKNLSPVLNKIMNLVVKCINSIKANVYQKQFEKFHWLQKCDVTDTATLNNVEHVKNLSADLKGRFSDLKEIDFPTWLMQPMLVNLSHISNMQYQEELAEMQNNESVKTFFNIKGSTAWFFKETKIKYPSPSECARKLLLPFPSSYLAECGFSAITDLLLKKRNRLDITQREDLRMKLTKLEPNIKSLCNQHQAKRSH